MRVKGGNKHKERRKKILAQASGFKGKRGTCYKIAKQRVMKALKNAYISRRLRKRDFRRLWILRINAASRARGLSYSQLLQGLKQAHVGLNRKMLAEIAVRDPVAFDKLTEIAKTRLAS